MALDIHVEAESASLRACADGMKAAARLADAGSQAASNASRAAFQGWTGDGSSGFQTSMMELRPQADGLSDGWMGAGLAIEGHADDIDTVRSRVQQAINIATAAGLTVTDREIVDPGPAPPEPGPISHNKPEVPAAGGSRAMAEAAWDNYIKKAKAYSEASAVVIEARQIETDSQNAVLGYFDSIASKWHINGTDLLTGVAGGFVSQQSTWKASAAHYSAVADDALGAAKNVALDSGTRAQNTVTSMIAGLRSKTEANRAAASRVGTWLEKLPKPIKAAVTSNLSQAIPKNAPYLGKASAVLKKVPGIGTALTGGSIYLDVKDGKDPTLSVVSNGAGLVSGGYAGAAVGSAFGGPIGAVAGFIVSTGVSYTVEEWGPDVVDYLEDRYDHVTKNPPPMPNDPRIPGPA